MIAVLLLCRLNVDALGASVRFTHAVQLTWCALGTVVLSADVFMIY